VGPRRGRFWRGIYTVPFNIRFKAFLDLALGAFVRSMENCSRRPSSTIVPSAGHRRDSDEVFSADRTSFLGLTGAYQSGWYGVPSAPSHELPRRDLVA
jgi:hypothetical protein